MKITELDLTKKIRRGFWTKGCYIEFSKKDYCFRDQAGINSNDTFCLGAFADDWEYYEEPKPKKRYWLWDIMGTDGELFRTPRYVDESGCNTVGLNVYPKTSLYRKHENEFIEI